MFRNLGVSSRTKFSVNTIEGYKNRNLFDVILLLEVIEHIKKDDQALRKIRSLLKKNGILILSTPSVNAPLHKIGFLKSFDKRVGHLRRYSTNQIETKINQSGLEVIEIIKNEGIVRNFIFTSTIGGKIILRLINRMAILRKLIVVIDDFFLKLFGESDILVIAKNP